MKEFDFICPKCGKTLRIDEAHQGKRTSCPACQAEIVIPPKPEEKPPQPKIVPSVPLAASPGDLLPQEEKDVFALRPTLKMYLSKLILAVLIPAAAIVLAVAIKATSTVYWGIILTGLAIGLMLFLIILYRKYSLLYRLSTQRLFVVRGLISRKVEELELFRVRDIQVVQGVGERILKFGRMTVFSTDATTPKFELHGVSNPLRVKDTIRVHFRAARLRERVRPTEFISDFDLDGLADKDPSL
jgi:membrane protein YdbS with pleckstrin-like domain/DNA-directed RNA polymerase subunit RPC12/RpoP